MKVATPNNPLKKLSNSNWGVTQALLEQRHWCFPTALLNTHAKLGLVLRMPANWILNWTTHVDRSLDVWGQLYRTTCHQKRSIMLVWKITNKKRTQPTRYTTNLLQRDAWRDNVSLASNDLLTYLQKSSVSGLNIQPLFIDLFVLPLD